MRDSGKASKSAIQGVIRDINDYTAIVQNELLLIMRETAELSKLWDDAQFEQFSECVDRMRASVESELQTISHARYELEKRMGMM